MKNLEGNLTPKIFRKINISYATRLIRICTCTYQGVSSVSFSENFVHVLNERSQKYRISWSRGERFCVVNVKVSKMFRKINISYPLSLIRKRVCAYQEVRNVRSLENYAWLLFCDTRFEIRPFALLPLVPFFAPWRHEKSPGFLIFSGGIEKKIVAWKGLPATCNLLKVLTYFYEPLSMRVFMANTKKIYNPFGYNSHKLHWSYWTLRFEYCTRRGCLHEISSFRA